MRQIATYFRIEWKRSIKILPWMLGSILLIILLLFLGSTVLRYVAKERGTFEKITLALVIPEDERESRIVAAVLSNLESVESICNTVYMDEEEARERMARGEVQAAVLLPEGFFEAVNTGINTPALILLPEQKDLPVRIFEELSAEAVSFVQTTEAAVYAAADIGVLYEAKLTKNGIEDMVFSLFLDAALEREELFARNVVSATGNYSAEEYYFAAVCAICLIMCGLNFGFLYQKKERAIEEKLSVYGVGGFAVSAVKTTVMATVLGGILMILIFAGRVVCGRRFFHMTVGGTLGIILLLLTIAGFFHVIYTYAGENAGVLLLLFNIGMILCTGAVVPVSYLPDALGGIGGYLPLSYWLSFLQGALFGQLSLSMLLPEFILLAAELALGAAKLWKRN